MQDAKLAALIQGLRGVQPVIVLVYLLVRRALTVQELRSFTGLSDDAIRPALQDLKFKGFLDVQRGERGRQTWLFRGDMLIGLEGQNPLPADSELLTSSSSTYPVKVPTIEQEEEEEPDSAASGIWISNAEELDAAGIREPARSRLAKLEHVTPEFIRAHVEGAKADGLEIGTAIHRIQYNWPAPEHRAGDHITSVQRRGRVTEHIIVPGDIVQEVAEFVGHRAGCSCMDCTVGRTEGIGRLCSDCHHYYCECEEREDA